MGPLERVHLIKILLWIAKTIDLPIQRKVESTLKVHKSGVIFLNAHDGSRNGDTIWFDRKYYIFSHAGLDRLNCRYGPTQFLHSRKWGNA